MVIQNNIKDKAIALYAVHWSKKLGRVSTCTTDQADVNEVVDCNTSGMAFPQAPFFLKFTELSNQLPRWYPKLVWHPNDTQMECQSEVPTEIVILECGTGFFKH